VAHRNILLVQHTVAAFNSNIAPALRYTHSPHRNIFVPLSNTSAGSLNIAARLHDIAALFDDIASSLHNTALRLPDLGVEICPCAFGFI
jgi:hypothetical protein